MCYYDFFLFRSFLIHFFRKYFYEFIIIKILRLCDVKFNMFVLSCLKVFSLLFQSFKYKLFCSLEGKKCFWPKKLFYLFFTHYK